MRIDFLGSFRSIQKGLQHEPLTEESEDRSPSNPPSFARILGERSSPADSRTQAQHADLVESIPQQLKDEKRSPYPPEEIKSRPESSQHSLTTSQASPDEMMGRLSVNLLQISPPAPNLSDIGLQPILPGTVKESIPSIPTPSIVSIKRYDSSHHFDKLSHPERIAEVERLIVAANEEQKADVPVPLALAVVSTESSFKSGSISQDGHETKGLFQFLDSTGREILTRFSDTEGYAPLDPGQNVNLGIRYLTHLNEIFSQPTQLNRGLSTIPGISGDSRKRIVLAAFNAGEGRVVRAQMRAKELGREPGNYSDISDFLPRSTTQYVERVLRREEEFSARNRQEPTPSFWR
jgi:hypothetical protein